MKLRDFYLEKVFPGLKAEKAQAFSTIVLTLIATAFFGLFAISPTLTTIADLQRQLTDNQSTDQQLQQKISNLSSLDQQYAALTNNLPVVYAALPPTPNASLLLGEIQSLAEQNHITLTQTQTSKIYVPPSTPQVLNIWSFTLSIQAQGAITDLTNFTNQLTKMNRILTITEIGLQEPLKNNTATNPSITITGNAFYNKQ